MSALADIISKGAGQEGRRVKLAVVSRIHVMYSAADSADKPLPHCTPSSSSGSLPSLVHFVLSVLCYTDELVICLGAPSLQALLHMQQRYEALLQSHFTQDQLRKVHLLPVYPWGHFTTALNVATLFVADLQADAIMFQSAECLCSPKVVEKLISHLTEDTMMVGLALPGHEIRLQPDQQSVEVELTGRTCPWNTCAVWRTDVLSLSGFPLIGDGFRTNRKAGGVEEVSAIALLQSLHPHLKAKLVLCDDLANWETTFEDPIRQKYHEDKMKSKEERPRLQLQAWGTLSSTGRVLHIRDTAK